MEDSENYTEAEFLLQEMEVMERNSETLALKRPRKKPKVAREWDEDDVYKLISLVEAEKCLWDASDEAYHNKTFRDSAWRNIEENFKPKYTVVDLNAKWTNLRIQFRGYAGRAKTKSGQGIVEVPKWRFYNSMSFVGRAEDKQTQQTVSNITYSVEEDIISSKSPQMDTQYIATPRKQPVVPTQSAVIVETMREAVSVMKERKESASDPNSTLANYFISELKALNPESAGAIRRKINTFFTECLEEERKKELN